MPDKKIRKSFSKVILVTLILVALFTGGYFAIRSNQAKNEIKYRIISTIENALDRGASIGRIKDYSLKSITLSDFKLFKNISLLDEDQIFEAEEIIIEYDLDFLSALKREVPLSIEDMTFVKPRMALIRDSQGSFDFMKKFNLSAISLFPIKRINIQEGNLDYIDYKTTKELGLLTSLTQLNGYFILEELPKVEMSCTAKRKEDNSPIFLEGYFSTRTVDYTLDFNFKDAEIAHFQYFFVQDEILKVKKGLFDSDLRLFHSLDDIPGKVNWEGKVLVKDTDLNFKALDNLEINQVDGSAIFNSQEINIESVTAVYRDSTFSLQGDLAYADNFRYNVKIKSDSLELSDLVEEAGKYLSLSPDFSLKGSSNLEVEISGVENSFQVDGKLLTEKGNVGGYDFLNLSAGFNYDLEGIKLEEVKVEIAEGLIKGNGEVNLSKELPEYTFSFDFSRLNTQSKLLKPLVSDYLKSGWLSGEVGLKGMLAEGKDTNLIAKIKIEDNELGDFQFETEGIIGKDNLVDINLKAEGIDLEKLAKALNYNEIKGQANFIGTLNGFPDNLKVKGTIETQKTIIAGLSFSNLESKIEYQDNKVILDDFSLENGSIHLRGKGEINLLKAEDRINVDIALQLTETDLAYLKNIYSFELPLSGITNGEITIQGDWPQITAQGDFKFTDINLADYTAESGNVAMTFKDEKIKIKNLALNLGKNTLYAQGEISLEDDYPLNLRVNFLNQDIQALLSHFIELKWLDEFRGQATGSMEIKGNIKSPDLYLATVIKDVQLEGLPLNSIDLKIEKVASLIKISRLELKQQKGGLIAEGWIDFHPDKENMQINIAANSIDLGQLSSFFNLNDEFEGLASFTAKAEGKINSPDVSFSAQIKKAKYAEFYFDELNMEALYNQEILKIKQFVLSKEGNQIIGKGEIPYRFSFVNKEKTTPDLADLPLDFTLNMENTDLKFLKLFFKDDFKQLEGLANLNLELSGTLNHPTLNGSIVLEGGEVEFYKSIPKISNLNAIVQLEDNLFKITGMDFKIDQFKMNTSGEVTLKNFKPQDLQLKLWSSEQEIFYEDIFKGQTDFDVAITGKFEFPCIKGMITLSQAELNLTESEETSFDINKILSELTDLKGAIDLKVKITDGFIAETKDFNLRLGGDIIINGDLSSPGLNGELNVEQGYIAFLDKRFRVSNGKIIFPDSLEKELILNINAKTKIDDIDILLHLGGSPSQLSMTLDSSPTLSESEIISLLMLNKNYAGLSEGEIGEVLKEEMISLLAQGLSLTFLNQIENEVANTLGLDEFNIETIFKSEKNPDLDQTNRVSLAGLALKMGKYFSENFYLTYSAPLYEAGKSNLEFEYKVKDDLTLSSQIGSTGSQDDEFELKFELQYEF
jgi:autotransporter translocation and assembly factor TamB